MHVIKRQDMGIPLYLSSKVGRDLGCPGGGWTQYTREADTWESENEAAAFLENMQHLKPFSEVAKL